MTQNRSSWRACWAALLLLPAVAALAGPQGSKEPKQPKVAEMPPRAGDWRLTGQREEKTGAAKEATAGILALYDPERESTTPFSVIVVVYPSGKIAKAALKTELARYEARLRSAGGRVEKKEDREGGEYYLLLDKQAGETEARPAGALWLYRNRLVTVSARGDIDPKELKEFADAFLPAAARLWAK
jgi:hypothetical protein